MRVTRARAEANRESLLQAAGQLFRARGIDGVGVAEIGAAAGLTHGALYKHFPSKHALAAEALDAGLASSLAAIKAAVGSEPRFGDYLDLLLSPKMRDLVEKGCPMTASASEVGRQGGEVAASFAKGFEALVAVLEAASDAEPSERRRVLALTAIAAEVGAITVARAVAAADPALSDEVLAAVRAGLGRLCGE